MAGKSGVEPKRVSKGGKPPKGVDLKDNLEHLLQQKEEIETLLGSLEDAYNEASIVEEDYKHVKKKNEEKLAEIKRKIDELKAKGVREEVKPAPVTPAPAVPAGAYAERPVRVVREVVKEVERPPKKPAEKPKVAREDKKLRKLMDDVEARITGKIKEIVAAAKVEESGKDVKEVVVKLDKFEIDVEKLKALLETVKEGRKILDEKMQRVTEGMAELRSIVYQREVSIKDQEIKFGKLMDSVSQVDPEKIVMEMKKRDREISNQGMKIERMGRIIDALNETIGRMKNVMVNIGSLENVIKVSNTVTENLQAMESLRGNIEKSADRVQSIYVELSERMEEFLLYRSKQDRMEDLVNELMRSVEDMNTKLSRFVTREDLEAFRQSFRPSGEAKADVINDLQIQKEEINMLVKTLEDEYKNKRISKEEFERTKKANLEKLEGIESKIKEEAERQAAAPAIPEAPEGETEAKPVEEKLKTVAPPKTPALKKKRSEALLKDLEDTYKKGFISKEAYERTKKMILSGKG
jgi:hypothetical protein